MENLDTYLLTVFSSSLRWTSEEKRDETISQPRSFNLTASTKTDSSALEQSSNEVDRILQSIQRTNINTDCNESNMDLNGATGTNVFNLSSEHLIGIPFFPALQTSPYNRSNNFTRRSQSSGLQLTTIDEIDTYLFERAKALSNLRPNALFVVHATENQMDHETLPRVREENVPLFDGAVSNATPLGGGNYSTGGGAGTILHLACALDSPFALAVLLIMGADASSRHTIFKRLMLHEAACSDSPQCLQLLIELGNEFYNKLEGSGIRVANNCAPGWGANALNVHLAQQKGPYLRQTKRIGEAQAKKANTEKRYSTVLQACLDFAKMITNGELTDIQAAKGLLQQVSMPDTNTYAIAATCRVNLTNSNTSDGHGNTALHWAAFKNSLNCCKMLVAHQANVNAVASSSGWTPLHDAAYSDSVETLSLLISSGANVNAKANSGATPLCFAAQEDAPNATRILLEAGADPTLRCCVENAGFEKRVFTPQNLHRFSGYTSLHYCAHYNAFHSAKVLLEYQRKTTLPRNKALLEISDLNEKLPIHICVARGSSEVLRELLHHGARIDTIRTRSRSMSAHTDDESSSSMALVDRNEGILSARSQSFDVHMGDDERGTISPRPTSALITPVSSPVLRSMIPSVPIDSSKPWNCISQRSIDECKMMIQEVELNWSPERHSIFHPADRAAVLELLRVGKRLEQIGTGIFIDMWPLVLSYCGRGWFEVNAHGRDFLLPPSVMHHGLTQKYK